MRHRTAAPAASNPTLAPTVNLQINRLTLHAYAPVEQKRFTQALQARLTEMAKTHHDWSAGLRMNRLDAGQLPAGATPEETARYVALQIFSKITQPTGGKRHA